MIPWFSNSFLQLIIIWSVLVHCSFSFLSIQKFIHRTKGHNTLRKINGTGIVPLMQYLWSIKQCHLGHYFDALLQKVLNSQWSSILVLTWLWREKNDSPLQKIAILNLFFQHRFKLWHSPRAVIFQLQLSNTGKPSKPLP